MTHRENFRRMMQHDRPQWLPLSLPMTPPIQDELERRTGSRDATAAFDLDFHGVGSRIPLNDRAWREAFAWIGAEVPVDAEIDSMGITHVVPRAQDVGKAYHFRQMLHPLSAITSVKQLEALPWPDVNDPANYAHLPERVAKIHAEGRVAVGGCACTIFENAWYVRGMDNLFMDLVDGNGIGDWLLEMFMRRSIATVSAFARAGVDMVHLGDDVGTQRGMMISVPMWREHLKPRLANVIAAVRREQSSPIWIEYHTDGDVRDIIPELIDIGMQVLNPCQPECMPADELVMKYKDRLAFSGLVGTQTTMPFGSPDDVHAVVQQCAAYVRAGAAILPAPTHVLEPEVPWANIMALVEAIKSQRL